MLYDPTSGTVPLCLAGRLSILPTHLQLFLSYQPFLQLTAQEVNISGWRTSDFFFIIFICVHKLCPQQCKEVYFITLNLLRVSEDRLQIKASKQNTNPMMSEP